MSNELIIVKQLPIIEEHLRALASEIDKRVTDAKSLVCTEDTYKDVKRTRAELSAQFKELEAQRIAVKKAVMDPYSSFEAIYKACVTDKFKDADADLKAKISEVEDGLKKQKEDGVRAFFDEYKSSLGIDFVSFENSGIAITMTSSKKSLKEKAQAYLDRVMDDLAMIGTQEFKDEILVEYKKTLNASQAVTFAIQRHAAIDEERQRREAAEVERANRKQAQMRVEDIVRETRAATSPMAPPVAAPAPESEMPGRDSAAAPLGDSTKIYAMTFTVRGTIDRLKQVKQFLTDGGFDYE